MKIKFIPLLFFLIFATFLYVPQGQSIYQSEIKLNFNWSEYMYYQGDTGTVIISLDSTCNNQLKITWIGISFEWIGKDSYRTLDFKENPVTIPYHGSHTFEPISFWIYSDASVGWNDYHVTIQFEEHHWYGWADHSWTSTDYRIYVNDIYHKIYLEKSSGVQSSLSSAINENFESSSAISALNNAEQSYDLSDQLFRNQMYRDACDYLTSTTTFIDQAYSYEISHWRIKSKDTIDNAKEAIEELGDIFGLAAKSSMEDAAKKLDLAETNYRKGSLLSLKSACTYAQESISHVQEAHSHEEKYWKTKSFTSINIVESRLENIQNVWSPEAKNSVTQATNKLNSAHICYAQGTIQNYKKAYDYAEKSFSLLAEIQTIEKEFRDLLMIVGIGVIVVAAITARAIR